MLPGATIALYCLLPLTSISLTSVCFVVHQEPIMTFGCNTFSLLMLKKSTFQIVRAPDVQFTQFIFNNIHVVHDSLKSQTK